MSDIQARIQKLIERENAELKEHLKLALYWMRVVSYYDPPRMKDVYRMERAASYIEEAMKEKYDS